MKPNRNVRWTEALKNFVRLNYATMDTADMAAQIGCTVSALQSKAQILNVTKRPKPWKLNRSAPAYLKDDSAIRREIATGIIIQSGHVTTHISRCSALLEEE